MATRTADREISHLKLEPPSAVEAERHVLGGLLLQPEHWPELSDRLTPEHFYDFRHQYVWRAMAAAHREHGSIDLGTVVTVAAQWIDNLGGLPYVTELSDHVTAIGPTYYAGLVEDAFRRRSVWLATARVHHDVTSALTASHALDLLTQAAEEEANRAPAEPQTMHTILGATWDAIKEYQYGAAGLVKSGLAQLDKLLVVLPPDLVVLAARPGQGKTAFALQWARHLLSEGGRVGFVSLEMASTQLAMRWLSSMSGVSTADMRRERGIDVSRYDSLTRATERMAGWDLCLDDSAEQTIGEIRAQVRQWHRAKPLNLLIVDYFQLLSGVGEYHSRENELADCSRQLKALAKELSIPVLLLCQMNRGIEKRVSRSNPNPRPTKADLRETGQLEQDADAILFLHEEDGQEMVLIDKQRQGQAPAEAHIRFDRTRQIFS